MTIVTETRTKVNMPWVVVEDSPALVAEFHAWLMGRDRSTQTIRGYEIGVATFQTWFEQTTGQLLSPALITPLDVRAFKAHLQAQGLQPNTINHYLAGVRAYCQFALATGRAEHNPVADIHLVAQTPQSPQWLTRPEQYALLRAVEQAVQLGALRARGAATAPGSVWPQRDRAVIRLLLAAGLRLAEAAALKVADVEIKPRSGSVTVQRGKGDKRREVPLNADARAALSSWLAVRPASESDALFLSQKGGALSARAIAQRVGELGAQAGIDGLHPHRLRHSCAKNLVDQGVGLEKVALLLGHSRLETTRLYTMPSAHDLQSAVELTCWSD